MGKDQVKKVTNLGQLNKILPVLTYLLKLHFDSFSIT